MAGASAYVLKDVRAGALLDVIRAVARGESPISQRLQLNQSERAVHAGDGRRPVRLSEREHRILGYISQGLTNREIAMRLNVAEKTVANNISVLLEKLGVRRRSQAAALAAHVRMLYE
jgi:DNA-binding NarL/FixJ family response regulator